MDFMEASKYCMTNWTTFSGRGARSEYWWFALFAILVSIVLQIIVGILAGESGGPLAFVVLGVYLVVSIFLTVAGISAAVRRLHDKDKSGWWYWIILVPIVGIILLLVWFCQRGTQDSNRFGQDPLGGADPEVFS